MTTTTASASAKTTSTLAPIVFVALVGAFLVFLTGLAQSQTLHDAAHDVRHSSGFPCH